MFNIEYNIIELKKIKTLFIDNKRIKFLRYQTNISNLSGIVYL